MRETFPAVVEAGRIRTGFYATEPGDRSGAFFLRAPTGAKLKVIASDGTNWDQEFLACDGPPWEHVSVSVANRCPTWDEMAWVKWLFWGDEEAVVEFHPPKSRYVNQHPYCLHLWRPVGVDIPLPPPECVGVRGASSTEAGRD